MPQTLPTDVMMQSDLDLPKKQGKVRDIYDLGDRLLLVATDRVSAFDVVLPTGIPDKGRILTQMSAFWFEKTRSVVPNHYLRVIDSSDNPDIPVKLPAEYIGRTMLVKKAEPVKLEAVVRGYLAGSGWAEYRQSQRVCGIPLPEGLRESDPLPQPIFTPSTKADLGQHDENITYRQAEEIVGVDVANAVQVRSVALYIYSLERAREAGFLLADTKFEFGLRREDGEEEIILIDEAITPDSSRFWDASIYKPGQSQPSYDKQPLRDWLSASGWNKQPPGPELPDEVVAQLHDRYLSAFTRVTGRDLIRP